MSEYALIKDGAFVEIRHFDNPPVDIPHKNVKWLPVVYQEDTFDPRYQELGPLVEVIEQTRYFRHKAAVNLSHEKMIEKVIAERERRLSIGFDYNFNDARGIHRIGTTEQDMKGWDEVTKAANSLTTLGLGTTSFNIVTNTGPVSVTAIEWLQIIVAATINRQPIWAASFALQAMESIPANFEDDSYWT
jgi:hypothetical protein